MKSIIPPSGDIHLDRTDTPHPVVIGLIWIIGTLLLWDLIVLFVMAVIQAMPT
jgi:hypothetical protein